MTPILLDLLLQLLSLACILGGVLGVLVLLELVRVALDEWRAAGRERGACQRIGVDSLCGVTERLVYPQVVRERR